jgi:hypothetical protein
MTTEQWLAAALNAAKNAGEDPLHAARALNSFLNGGDLSYADTLVVNAAVDAVGTPPGFSSVPPGSWSSRALPSPAGVSGDPAISRLIGTAGQPGVFAQYTDGTVRWIENPTQLSSIVSTNPNLQDQNGQPVITALATTDPIWDRATYGAGGKAAYVTGSGGAKVPGTATG